MKITISELKKIINESVREALSKRFLREDWDDESSVRSIRLIYSDDDASKWMYQNIHIKTFNDKSAFLDFIFDSLGFDGDINEDDSLETIANQVADYFSEVGGGFPVIIYLSVNGEVLEDRVRSHNLYSDFLYGINLETINPQQLSRIIKKREGYYD